MPPERPTAGAARRQRDRRQEPPRRGGRSLASAAEEAVRPLLRKRGFRESALIREWREIIGPQLARRTAPVSLSRGVLTVRVEPAFATEFQHRSAMVMERIAMTYGSPVVKRIVVKQGPVQGRSRHEPQTPSRAAPTDRARRQVAARTATVRHVPLRDALTRLGGAVAGRGRESGKG
ncbi:MAG: DUF721 domain-containing protein [Rhodospirillales bacterium]|nr:DUF721 domain-containing protein [Rhodospirillales bacterium]MDE0372015.1 DUF721 domain-containing protein [Rhodospirillales bacterium]